MAGQIIREIAVDRFDSIDSIDSSMAPFCAPKVKELALRDEISVNQFIAAALSEKMASIMTLDYLMLEAAKGTRNDFDRLMNLVPNAPVTEGDELPNH